MADTVLSDALPGIQDEGLPNITDGNEDWGSAGLRMVLAQAVDSGSYVRSDAELTFTNHDGTNDTVDVTAGIAYLDLTGETVNIQSTFGGISPPDYDTALPTLPAIPVIVPTAVTGVPLQDATASDVWLAYATDGTVTNVAAGDVYVRSDDTGSVTAPPHPNVLLGSANPDNAGADVLSNRFPSPELRTGSVSTREIEDTGTDGQVLTSTGGTGPQYEGVPTEPNVPNWQEDGAEIYTNQNTVNYTLTADYDKVLILDKGDNTGLPDMRVNGSSNTNYNYVDSADSRTTGATEWPLEFPINRAYIMLVHDGNNNSINMVTKPATDSAGVVTRGRLNENHMSIDSITFTYTSGSTTYDGEFYVYGWSQ